MTHVLVALLFVLSLAGEWLLTLFSLPGNWLMILTCAGYAAWFFEGHAGGLSGWTWVGIAAAVAVVGEVAELAASAAGVARGGSRRGGLLAMAGAMVGSLVGAAAGIPIPVVGSVIGVLLGASLGAMTGAFVGETWKGRSLSQSLSIGTVAFIGRLLGSVAKLICGAVIVALGFAMCVFG